MAGWVLQLIFLAAVTADPTIFFSETFPEKNSIENWVQSSHHGSDQGEFKISAGSSPVDPDADLGIQTSQDAKFYGITKMFEKHFSNEGKPLVVQYTVKFDRIVDCGGAYIKLLGSDFDQKKFHGDTPYKIMFGPDICGISTKKVHVILNHGGQNHLIKREHRCEDDTRTHLYTLVLTPDNKYKVLIDNTIKIEGEIDNDWDILPPKMIDDTSVSKPADWVDESMMVDPDDKKSDDWDQPKMIIDPQAKKPEDWDDEMDGEWEAPKIENPEYKGDWKAREIPNPAYKGPWKAPQIPNPEYAPDPLLYKFDDIAAIGIDLWQVTSGSIFDNFLITDDEDFAKAEGERLWRPRYNAEKKLEEDKLAKEKSDDVKDEKKEEEMETEEETTAEKIVEEPTVTGEKVDQKEPVEKDVHEEL